LTNDASRRFALSVQGLAARDHQVMSVVMHAESEHAEEAKATQLISVPPGSIGAALAPCVL
jgi:hypothetical protein